MVERIHVLWTSKARGVAIDFKCLQSNTYKIKQIEGKVPRYSLYTVWIHGIKTLTGNAFINILVSLLKNWMSQMG